MGQNTVTPNTYSQVDETMRDVYSKITGSVRRGIKLEHVNLNKQYESSKKMKAFFGSGIKVGFGDDPV